MSERKLTQQEASAQIANLIRSAEAKISEAEKIADEYGVSFSWDGPSYGMGGWYTGKSEKPEWADSDWEASDEGWSASSQSC